MQKIYLILIFILGSFLYTSPIVAQNAQRFVEIQSCRLVPKLMAIYKKRSLACWTISEQGDIKPVNGYKMIKDEKTGRTFVIDSQIEMTHATNWDTKPVPGGQATCLCGSEGEGGDDCKYYTVIKDNTITDVCQGTCDCGITVILDKTATIQ